MSAMPVPRLTPEQYLEIERAAEFKSEYYDGQMFAMSGGLLPHSMIGVKLASALDAALRGRGCVVTNSDLRVGITSKGPFFYPDASVCCGEPQLSDDYKDTLLNPTVIFEVLSDSTEAFDRGKKFAAYRRIGTLREYVLVSQTEPLAERYSRNPEGQWTLTEFSGTDAMCTLHSISCDIALADIYRDVPLALNPK
jgi:Uma2 family endonuclease